MRKISRRLLASKDKLLCTRETKLEWVGQCDSTYTVYLFFIVTYRSQGHRENGSRAIIILGYRELPVMQRVAALHLVLLAPYSDLDLTMIASR